MAKDTAQKIRTAALELFSNRWFETVSVAEICRQAEVSNGVFYRYFAKKTDLVRDLLETFLEKYETELLDIRGDSVRQRLEHLYRVILRSGAEHFAEVAIFREGQYRFPEYEARLRRIYLSCCELVYKRPISEAEYLYIISGLRFNSTRAMYDGLPRNIEIISDLVLNGIFNGESLSDIDLQIPDKFPEVADDSATDSRDRLIQSGIELLGKDGYHAIGVGDIARRTGLAVGTFYIHFSSKEEFFSQIVQLIGQKTRKYLSDHARQYKNRLEQEIYGVWYFLSYFNKHPEYYAIVREAEFVAKPWVREYYNAFEAGYMRNLPITDKDERRVAGNFLMGLSHYVGIEALLNCRIPDISAFIAELAKLMHCGISK